MAAAADLEGSTPSEGEEPCLGNLELQISLPRGRPSDAALVYPPDSTRYLCSENVPLAKHHPMRTWEAQKATQIRRRHIPPD